MCRKRWIRIVALAAGLACVCIAEATWSIVIVDRETKEVAIGSATCLKNLDLQELLPVVLVDVGAGAAQSAVDADASNRVFIHDQLLAGASPAQILQQLEAIDPAHQTRQYGIVDTLGRAVTFSGANNGAYANGVTGQIGSLVYSIQGNVITGQPVIDQAEAAVIMTPGGIPEKLMAAMEAARDMGGDGRCSCDPRRPTNCGSPPPTFKKSAHIGFIVDTRRGDIDGDCSQLTGCANGTYYMSHSIAGQLGQNDDPVDQMREWFEAWRADLTGVPDAVESQAIVTPDRLLNDGVSIATVTVAVLDWEGNPATGITDVAIMHDPSGGAGSSTIGPVTDLGGGVFETTVTAGVAVHHDRLAVRVTDVTGERFLIPSLVLRIQDQRADLNGDGVVDLGDLSILLAAYGVDAGGDVDGDGDTDLADLALLLQAY